MGASVIRSRFSTNYVMTLGIYFVNALALWGLTESFMHGVFEPRFVANDQVIDELAKKYNFTVFDFAQAKKESHLKILRAQLIQDTK